jgi:hypothetical protein
MNMNDEQLYNNIDELGRQAAEGLHMPFRQDAWEKMEALLDKKKKRRRFLFWWMSGVLLLVLSAAGYMILSRSGSNDNRTVVAATTNGTSSDDHAANTPQNSSTDHTTQTRQAHTSAPVPGKQNEMVTQGNTATGEKAKSGQGSDQQISTAQSHNSYTVNHGNKPSAIAGNNKIYADRSAGNRTKNPGHIVSTATAAKRNRNKSKEETKTVTNEQVNTFASSIAVNENKALTTKKNTGIVTATIPADSIAARKPADSLQTAKKEPSADSSSVVTKPKITLPKPSKFTFGAWVGGDVTTVKLKHSDKLSYSGGIAFSYDLSKRFSIATGIGIAKKLYGADSADYKNAYAPYHYKILDIQGNCTVIEIPVQLQYKWSISNKSTWIALAGLSTYLMNRETYTYDYDYYGNKKTMAYTYNNESRHYFSVLSLGAAYRRQLSKTFSWQLAPFVKIPLSGIGKGNVALYSGGLTLGIFYNKH